MKNKLQLFLILLLIFACKPKGDEDPLTGIGGNPTGDEGGNTPPEQTYPLEGTYEGNCVTKATNDFRQRKMVITTTEITLTEDRYNSNYRSRL